VTTRGGVLLNESTHAFTDANWDDEVLQAERPVLVDFWAGWCPPCRKIAPLIEELAREFAGRVKVGKLDVDRSPETAARYGITSIPTLLVLKAGQVVAQRVGALPREQLRLLLDAHAPERLSAAG
jgi:thioredoxin 1